MVSTVFLVLFALTATVTDLWRGKIYNWTTYTGSLVAMSLAALATWLAQPIYSDVFLVESVAGFAVCGVIMLVCFVLFQIGGGDVKLLAMFGAFLGVENGIETLLWTFVIGGAAAVIFLIWRNGFFRLSRRVFQQLGCKLGFGNWDPLTKDEKEQLKLPLFLAPSGLLAMLIVKFSLVDVILGRT